MDTNAVAREALLQVQGFQRSREALFGRLLEGVWFRPRVSTIQETASVSLRRSRARRYVERHRRATRLRRVALAAYLTDLALVALLIRVLA